MLNMLVFYRFILRSISIVLKIIVNLSKQVKFYYADNPAADQNVLNSNENENQDENENENRIVNVENVNNSEGDEQTSPTSQQAYNFDLNLPTSHSVSCSVNFTINYSVEICAYLINQYK